ncbi:MAG TPA: DUF4249 domain-containing protein [Bacteroidia bacterium]|nr:DUF4249 domain-containing protein [Bacteroidia bacterium]
MKKIFFPLFAVFVLLASSCQKVIDVDLNSKDPQIVIEGNITDQPGPYTVSITQTVNFSESNTFPPVTGATVNIADNVGNSETLTENSPGVYQTNSFQGVPGRTYTLTVITNGKTYTAQSTMPSAIPLDSLLLEPNQSIGSPYYIIPLFQDPAGKGNYYRCVETINHVRNNGIFLFDDQFSDGLINGEPILDFTTELAHNDSVDVELQCLDKATYTYFFSLEQTLTGQTTAPANPVSNISNHALGYFSAHTVSRKSTVIP